ncbi:MAG: AMP-binding protein, partial [bacterium]|nr:AMP-binding protein [bacterium]
TPERVAVTGIGQPPHSTVTPSALTYRQFNRTANRLARRLREKGVTTDTIVGIMMERSIAMPVIIMGILKAGGAYLPIDTGYPEERIRYMLTDSCAHLLLTGEKHAGKKYPLATINIEKELAGLNKTGESSEDGDEKNRKEPTKPDSSHM